MLSAETINDLHLVIDNINNRIKMNESSADSKDIENLIYQKIMIEQLIAELHTKKINF